MSELKLTAALISAGYVVSVPAGDYSRYDAIIDDGASLKKVQFKTARYLNGSLNFCACSSDWRYPTQKKAYIDEVDMFGVYSPDLDRCFLVPVDAETPKREVTLRVDPPKNNQKTLVRYADVFEITPR